MSARSVGIDVGGTFTDLVSIDHEGRTSWAKVLSTPSDQSEGVDAALGQLAAPPEAIERIVHGTTVATNTLLERDGARVVLCATEGFTDLLRLRRQERASLYDLTRHHPEPLVAEGDCIGVRERVGADGVLAALDEGEAERVGGEVANRGAASVAVALLHAYAFADHERRLAGAIGQAADGTPGVVLSSEVLPEIREYERTATTVAEAYLRPRIAHYVGVLGDKLGRHGYPHPSVMTSSGGMLPAHEAARRAAALALSGPAGGVVGAAHVAALAGFPNALTIDIGGTSADAGLILDGEPLTERGGEVAGVAIALPRVLVETVSAGGGSIGWVDDAGVLRTGPRSAGAHPGPAAFGRGGEQPTVTDAHVALGHIAGREMSGGVSLDATAAQRALARLAARLGRSVDEVARAMIASADARIARALRRVSVERGIDPRGCALIAFGGGGPLHGCALAEQLGMRTVIVPPLAGVLSALGLAISPERREALRSLMTSAHLMDVEQLRAVCDDVAGALPVGDMRQWWVRARYQGQGHELEVAIAPGDDGAAVARRFGGEHAMRFGFTLEHDVELVSMRYSSGGRRRDVRLERFGAPVRRTGDGIMVDTGGPLDATIAGPAVVALGDATLRIAAGWSARALPIGGWLLEHSP